MDQSHSSNWQRQDTAIILILIAIVLLLALPTLNYPLGRDQGEFATIARGLLDGRTLYTELWNPKPPAIFIVYSAAIQVFGVSSLTIRLIDFLFFPVMAVGIYWLALRINRQLAVLATLALGAYYFSESFWTLSQNDGIVLAPMLLAAVAALKALQDGRWHYGWAGVAGGMSAIVLWFKYPFIVFVAAIVLTSVTVRMWRRDWLRLGVESAVFITSGLILGALGIYWLFHAGALDAWIDSAIVTTGYTQQGYDWGKLQADTVWQAGLAERLRRWNLLLGLMLLWPLLRWRVPRHQKDSILWLLVWLWLTAGLVIVLIQAKGYDYHWLPMLPPLILIATDSYARLLLGAWRLLGGIQGLLLQQKIFKDQTFWLQSGQLLLMLLICGFMLDQIWQPNWDYLSGEQSRSAYLAQFRGGEYVASESQAVIDYLKPRVAPNDHLYVWGFRPEIYFLSQTRPATRFIFQFPLVADWYPVEWRQQEVEQLWFQTSAGTAPAYVLILKADYMPWVTGYDLDSNQLLQAYEPLNSWIMYNYEFDTQIGNFLIWRTRTTPFANSR